MRNFLMALGAASLVLPAAAAVSTNGAAAQDRHAARQWRGRDGRLYCRRPNGTTGLIVGGVAGGLLGNAVIGGASGTVLGAAGGALGGRAIERGSKDNRRCR